MTSHAQGQQDIKPYKVSHYIDGRVVVGHGERSADVDHPSLEQVVGTVTLANQVDINEVVAVTKKASHGWADAGIVRRAKVVFALHDPMVAGTQEMAEGVTREHGKVLSDAKGEIDRAIETVKFACGILGQFKGGYSDQVSGGINVFSISQPLGVIVGITPFTFPVMVPMWMAPVAIACGNAFILKPSERDPSVSLVLTEMWKEAGICAIFGAPDKAELAAWAEDNLPEGMAVFDLPEGHRRRLRTTNGLERVNRELKRRTRVPSIFPNSASCLRLVSAPLAEQDEQWLTAAICISMND